MINLIRNAMRIRRNSTGPLDLLNSEFKRAKNNNVIQNFNHSFGYQNPRQKERKKKTFHQFELHINCTTEVLFCH